MTGPVPHARPARGGRPPAVRAATLRAGAVAPGRSAELLALHKRAEEAVQAAAAADGGGTYVLRPGGVPAAAFSPPASRGTPELKLYRDTNAWCPFCERVWLALEYKGAVPSRPTVVHLRV